MLRVQLKQIDFKKRPNAQGADHTAPGEAAEEASLHWREVVGAIGLEPMTSCV
jgi:hypothetical protein